MVCVSNGFWKSMLFRHLLSEWKWPPKVGHNFKLKPLFDLDQNCLLRINLSRPVFTLGLGLFLFNYFRAFWNIFQNILRPLCRVYIGRPTNIGPRIRGGAFSFRLVWAVWYSNSRAVQYSNGNPIPDYLASNLFSTIWIPNEFCFQIPTVIRC